MPATIPTIDPQATGWRAVADVLRNSPKLRVINTWRIGEGAEEEPTTGLLNWCRIMPLALPAEAKGTRGPSLQRTYLCPIQLSIDLATSGPDPSALISLWGLFEGVIFPADSTERLALRTTLAEHGIRDIRLLQRAAPASPANVSTALVVGTGSVALDFYLDI